MSSIPENKCSCQEGWEAFQEWRKADDELVVLHRAYPVMTGDLPTAMLLAQLVYWHSPSAEGTSRLRIQKEGRSWVAASAQEIEQQCFLTNEQSKRAVSVLETLGLIETRLFGFGGKPTRHFRLNKEAFVAYWQSATAHLEKLTAYQVESKAAKRERRAEPEKPVYEQPALHSWETRECDNHGKATNPFVGDPQNHLGETRYSNTEALAEVSTKAKALEDEDKTPRTLCGPQGGADDIVDEGKHCGPPLSDVIAFFAKSGLDRKQAETFWDYHEAYGWVQRFGKPLRSWQKTATNWIKRQDLG